jgi:death on curing protein
MTNKNNIQYISVNDIINIHTQTIKNFGGLSGIKSIDGLESAASQPYQEFSEVEFFPDLPAKAAAYMYFISEAHAFNDGNKRTALQTAISFLELNGISLGVNTNKLFEAGVKVASNQMSKEQLIELFRQLVNSI